MTTPEVLGSLAHSLRSSQMSVMKASRNKFDIVCIVALLAAPLIADAVLPWSVHHSLSSLPPRSGYVKFLLNDGQGFRDIIMRVFLRQSMSEFLPCQSVVQKQEREVLHYSRITRVCFDLLRDSQTRVIQQSHKVSGNPSQTD